MILWQENITIRPIFFLILFLVAMAIAGCGPKYVEIKPGARPPHPSHPTYRPYKVNGRTYYPLPSAHGFVQEGYASWYGREFHKRPTANGEPYNMYAMTAAHKTLPMNTYVRVLNLENGKETVVRINDRGPFVKNRIIDLSYSAAKKLGIVGQGTARVRIEALAEGHIGPTGRPKFQSYPDLRHGIFYVQVGAFVNPSNAHRLRRKLATRYKEVVVSRHRHRGTTFYRVQIFAATTYGAAKKFEAKLEQSGFPGAFVVAK